MNKLWARVEFGTVKSVEIVKLKRREKGFIFERFSTRGKK
jgi:hypothetical protein